MRIPYQSSGCVGFSRCASLTFVRRAWRTSMHPRREGRAPAERWRHPRASGGSCTAAVVIAAGLPHDRALEVRRPRALAACRVHQSGVSRQLIAEFESESAHDYAVTARRNEDVDPPVRSPGPNPRPPRRWRARSPASTRHLSCSPASSPPSPFEGPPLPAAARELCALDRRFTVRRRHLARPAPWETPGPATMNVKTEVAHKSGRNDGRGSDPRKIGGAVRVRLMRDGMAPPDPLHLVGYRRTLSSPWRRASS